MFPYNAAALWTSLAQLSGANSLPSGGACLSMPAQFNAVVSFRRTLDDRCDRHRRQFWSFCGQSTARSVTALNCPSPRRKYGTLCRLTSHLHPHCRHWNGHWKLSFSSAVTHPTVPIYSRYCLAMHENYWCYVNLQLFALRHVNCRSFLLTYLLTYLPARCLSSVHE